MHEIYRPTEYIATFTDTFLSNRDDFPLMKNVGSGMRYKTAFIINANQVMDMKNGLKWNQGKQAEFRLNIHPNFDMPEIRDNAIRIDAGFKTTIRLNAIQLQSEQSIEDLEIKKRQCKFRSEADGMAIFKTYSRYVLRSWISLIGEMSQHLLLKSYANANL